MTKLDWIRTRASNSACVDHVTRPLVGKPCLGDPPPRPKKGRPPPIFKKKETQGQPAWVKQKQRDVPNSESACVRASEATTGTFRSACIDFFAARGLLGLGGSSDSSSTGKKRGPWGTKTGGWGGGGIPFLPVKTPSPGEVNLSQTYSPCYPKS